MAGKKNTTVFSWSAIARKCGFKYDYIRLGRLSEEEKEETKITIEKDASVLLGKKYKLIEVSEQKRESNACSSDCNSCVCLDNKQGINLD